MNMEENKEQGRSFIYILKGLAIICVVCAHSTMLSSEAGKSSIFIAQVLDYLGTMGVPIFFLLSGYLFEKNHRDFWQFWKRKLTTILVPWLFCDTLLWFYVVLRKGGISFRAWLLFILGYKSSTYYLTVLMVLFFLFWFIKKDGQIYLVCIFSIGSIVSTGWGGGINFLNTMAGTFYLNALNWAVFFGVGIIFSRKKKWYKMLINLSKPFYLWLFCSSGYFLICRAMNQMIYYFGRWAVMQHIINVLLLIRIAAGLNNKKSAKVMEELGKYSFSIYLLHQFVSGIIVAVMNKFPWGICVVIRPVLIIAIVMLGIWIIEKIMKLADGKLDFVGILIGIRG